MSKSHLWRLATILLVAGLVLAACGGVDPNLIICKNNPAAVKDGDPVCRSNIDGGIGKDEVRVPAVIVGNQQKAIYYGYVEDARPIILDSIGAHQYPASQSIVLPLQVQDFRTDSNPDGDFCAGQKPRCIAPMGDVTLEYTSADGQIRTLSGVTINLQGSLRFSVEDSTASTWLRLNRTSTEQDFWYKFWDAVRVPKIISISSSGVDPVSDQWGEKTNQAIAAVLTARVANWEYAPLLILTDEAVQVKSVEAPTVPGAVTGGNIDAQATQNAVQLGQAEAYATREAIICQSVKSDEACAWHMQNFEGGNQAPPQVVIQAGGESAPAPTATTNP